VVDAQGNVSEVPRERIPAHEVLPQMYAMQMEKVIGANAYGIERDKERTLWQGMMNTRYGQRLVEVQAASLKAQTGAIRADQTAQMDEAIARMDRGALVLLAANFEGSPAEREMFKRRGLREIEGNEVGNALSTGNAAQVDMLIKRMTMPQEEYEKAGGLLSPKERLAYAEQLKHKGVLIEGTAMQQRQMADNADIEKLYNSARKGHLNLASLDAIGDRMGVDGRPLLTPIQKSQLREMNSSNQVRQKVESDGVNELLFHIRATPGVPVVGTDPDRMKAADQLYMLHYAGKIPPNAAPEVATSVAIQFVKDTNYIPTPLKQQLINGGHSPDPKVKAATAALFMHLENVSRGAVDLYLSKEQLGDLPTYASQLRMGMTPEDIHRNLDIKARQTPAQKEAIEGQAKIIKTTMMEKGPQEFVKFLNRDMDEQEQKLGAAFDPKFNSMRKQIRTKQTMGESLPAVPHDLIPTLANHYERELAKSPESPAAAMDRANRLTAQEFAFTDVNTKVQIMRYPPNMLNPAATGAAVQAHVKSQFPDASWNGKKFDRLVLASVTNTTEAVQKGKDVVPYAVYGIYKEKGREFEVPVGRYLFRPRTFSLEYNRMLREQATAEKVRKEIAAQRPAGLTELEMMGGAPEQPTVPGGVAPAARPQAPPKPDDDEPFPGLAESVQAP
jgi:hypothetical protein